MNEGGEGDAERLLLSWDANENLGFAETNLVDCMDPCPSRLPDLGPQPGNTWVGAQHPGAGSFPGSAKGRAGARGSPRCCWCRGDQPQGQDAHSQPRDVRLCCCWGKNAWFWVISGCVCWGLVPSLLPPSWWALLFLLISSWKQIQAWQ